MWSMIGTAVILVAVYIIYYSPSLGKKLVATNVGPLSLAEEQTAIKEEQSRTFYSGAEGSFSAFVYVNDFNRTGSHAACGTNANQPSCSNGTFAPCPCDATSGDCSSQCKHIGYTPIFNVAGIVALEVLMAPDASRQGKAMVHLTVKTEGPSLTTGVPATQKYIETLRLPELAIQGWTMVTVAREGRRFDVYYNDRIVLSQKTMYMPSNTPIASNFRGIVSGSTGLGGKIGLMNVYDYRLSSVDVAGIYSSSVDTRGRPFINDPTGSTGGIISTRLGDYLPQITICPPGGCISAPVVRPASPLYDWSSSYA